MAEPMNDEQAMEQLLQSLDVEPADDDVFRGEVHQEEGRLFGGLVLAQSVMAAGKTVTDRTIHSLHAYFLRAGRPKDAIDYHVERIRKGRNFDTRRVTAVQVGHTIFEASIGFTRTEEGIDHQLPMPDVPPPEGLKTWWETFSEEDRPRGGPRRRWHNPIDIRSADPPGKVPIAEGLPRRNVWARVITPLPEDPLIHAAMMVYMSDSGMVGTVAQAYSLWGPGGSAASLDHAVWWHHPPRFEDWILYVTESPAGHAARALTFGHMFTRSGVLVASVTQEALFRKGEGGELELSAQSSVPGALFSPVASPQ